MSHYIRIDDKSRIIYGFSDAFEHEQVLESDICILDDPMQFQRQFMLKGQYNPVLFDMLHRPLYKYIGEEVLECTEEDWTDIIPPEPPYSQIDEMQSQIDALSDTILLLIGVV